MSIQIQKFPSKYQHFLGVISSESPYFFLPRLLHNFHVRIYLYLIFDPGYSIIVYCLRMKGPHN